MKALYNPALLLMVAMFLYIVAEALCRRWDRRNTSVRVRVWWEGQCHTHAAKSEQEGRAWASCYPAEATVSIEHVHYDRAEFVAGRNLAF